MQQIHPSRMQPHSSQRLDPQPIVPPSPHRMWPFLKADMQQALRLCQTLGCLIHDRSSLLTIWVAQCIWRKEREKARTREGTGRKRERNRMIFVTLNSVSEFNKFGVPLKQQKVSSFASTSPAYEHPTRCLFIFFFSCGRQDLHTNKKLKEKNFNSGCWWYILMYNSPNRFF